jgi:hypothetical protein
LAGTAGRSTLASSVISSVSSSTRQISTRRWLIRALLGRAKQAQIPTIATCPTPPPAGGTALSLAHHSAPARLGRRLRGHLGRYPAVRR